MPLTSAQLQTLKSNIAASADLIPASMGPLGFSAFIGLAVNTTTFNGQPTLNNADFNACLAAVYNLASSPAKIVWRSAIPTREVGQAQLSADVGGLTTANTNRLGVLAQYAMGLFTGSADTEAGFADIFSSAPNTLTRLHAVWRRTALRIEALYATGTGSDVAPATLVFEGTVTGADIQNARNN